MTCSKGCVAVKATILPNKFFLKSLRPINTISFRVEGDRSHRGRVMTRAGRKSITTRRSAMARFKFRRSLRFDNLEGRQCFRVSEQGPPTSSNTASVDQRGADEPGGGRSADLERDHAAGLGDAPVLRRQSPVRPPDDLVGHAAAAPGLECQSGERRARPEPVHGRQPDPDRTPGQAARRRSRE